MYLFNIKMYILINVPPVARCRVGGGGARRGWHMARHRKAAAWDGGWQQWLPRACFPPSPASSPLGSACAALAPSPLALLLGGGGTGWWVVALHLHPLAHTP